MRTNNKKGISLIVLIITIIVMIILAAAIILSISNSGIMDKANKAKTESDIANLKEYANVLMAEWELMDTDERSSSGYASKEAYVNGELYKKYPDAALGADGEVYAGLNEAARQAIVGGIQIGDVVTGYTLDTNKTPYTTSGKENTAPTGEYQTDNNPTKQTIQCKEFAKWRYIGISDNGEIMIAPDVESDSPVMKLSGQGAYFNGAEELNKVCESLYSTNKGTARSMNIDDVVSILEYTGCKGGYYNENGFVPLNEALTVEEVCDLLDEFDKSTIADPTAVLGEPSDWSAVRGRRANYYEILESSDKINSSRKSLIFFSDTYWLASEVNYIALYNFSISDSGSVYFHFRTVTSTNVGTTYLSSNIVYPGAKSFILRPVVQLNSDVPVSYSNGVLTLN